MEKKYIIKLTKSEIESLIIDLQCIEDYDDEKRLLERFKILLTLIEYDDII